MSTSSESYTSLSEHLGERKDYFATTCTKCGDCVIACPIVPFSPLKDKDPEQVAGELLGLVTQGVRGEDALAWAACCTICGACIDHCPEGINPREMLYVAKNTAGVEGVTSDGLFTLMARGIKLLANLQMSSADYKRLTSPTGWGTPGVEVLFYYGCNVLRTPDILLTAVEILHRLGVRFGLLGGMGNCCSVLQFRGADTAKAQKIENSTYDRWLSFDPQRVLLWCPSCEIQFLESGLRERRKPEFPIDHFTAYLVERLADLEHLYVNAVPKTAVLHEHAGLDLGVNVRKLLSSVPGLKLVEIPQLKEHSYTCGIGSLSLAPDAREEVHKQLLENVAAAGADVLITPDHGCHASLCEYEAGYEFEVKNFLSIIGEALGITHEDLYKRYMLAGSADAVTAAAAPFIEQNKLSDETVRASVWDALTWVQAKQ